MSRLSLIGNVILVLASFIDWLAKKLKEARVKEIAREIEAEVARTDSKSMDDRMRKYQRD